MFSEIIDCFVAYNLGFFVDNVQAFFLFILNFLQDTLIGSLIKTMNAVKCNKMTVMFKKSLIFMNKTL